jgi:TonB-dependent starch-binding outer membrane protein SusC
MNSHLPLKGKIDKTFYQVHYLKYALVLAILLCVSGMAYAQNQITGKVTSAANEGLPGVTVLLKGTNNGTTTDVNGGYTLSVPGTSGTLVFSFIGYTTTEKNFSQPGTVNVTLQTDAKALEEVVVIGYGTARKSDLTGAVASVKEEQIKERAAPSLNQALAGKMPGVQVNTNSGRPGGRTNIRIRGFSSINSSNNPLYVIDGVMMPQMLLLRLSTEPEVLTALFWLPPKKVNPAKVRLATT